jgi:hypothetical protein
MAKKPGGDNGSSAAAKWRRQHGVAKTGGIESGAKIMAALIENLAWRQRQA